MMYFEVITMAMSCLYWKKLYGPVKLYCDKPFLEYIKKLDLIWLWDEIDSTTIDSVLVPNVNYDIFWAYPKMVINSLQTEPFASLDLDLFLSEKLNFNDEDIYYSHIELGDAHNEGNEKITCVSYPDFHKWDRFKSVLTKLNELNIPDWVINVSIVVFNNTEICKKLLQYTEEFIVGNYYKPKGQIHPATPMTFVEQRMLAAIVENFNYTHKSIIGNKYDPVESKFINSENFKNPGITHLWGLKHKFRVDMFEEMKRDFTKEIEDEFKENFPKEFSRIERSGKVTKFCPR